MTGGRLTFTRSGPLSPPHADQIQLRLELREPSTLHLLVVPQIVYALSS